MIAKKTYSVSIRLSEEEYKMLEKLRFLGTPVSSDKIILRKYSNSDILKNGLYLYYDTVIKSID